MEIVNASLFCFAYAVVVNKSSLLECDGIAFRVSRSPYTLFIVFEQNK